MKIETVTFFRTHLLIGGKRELFPVVNLVLDQDYPGLVTLDGLSVQLSTERTDSGEVPMVLCHVDFSPGGGIRLRKTKTIDYTSEETVHFFEDLFSGDPFLFAFSTPAFLNGKTKDFQYIPATIDQEQGKLFRWDVELAYTDSTSRNLDRGMITGTFEKWWHSTGKTLNDQQDHQ